jgi:hypothetical protein
VVDDVSCAEMGSRRVQPESAWCLARDFVKPDRSREELDRARIQQGRVGNGHDGGSDRADRVECLKYPAQIDRESIRISTRDM